MQSMLSNAEQINFQKFYQLTKKSYFSHITERITFSIEEQISGAFFKA